MKNKRYMSLQSELIAGIAGSVLFVAVFLTVFYVVFLNSLIKKTTVNSVNQTMQTLDKEISGISVDDSGRAEYHGAGRNLTEGSRFNEGGNGRNECRCRADWKNRFCLKRYLVDYGTVNFRDRPAGRPVPVVKISSVLIWRAL